MNDDPTVTLVMAARGLLDWTQSDLAKAAGFPLPTIRRYEWGISSEATVKAAIVRALEDAGVVFVHDGNLVGVAFRRVTGNASPSVQEIELAPNERNCAGRIAAAS